MRSNQHSSVIALAVAALIVSACGDVTSLAEDAPPPMPGLLQLANYTGTPPAALNSTPQPDLRWSFDSSGAIVPPRVIEAPDTVSRGVPFDVTVYTIGENGCWRTGMLNVQTGSGVTELRPFDIHSGADICTLALSLLQHREAVTLNEAGDWTLRVIGRRMVAGRPPQSSAISAEKTIHVR